jgi:hypothetical protein
MLACRCCLSRHAPSPPPPPPRAREHAPPPALVSAMVGTQPPIALTMCAALLAAAACERSKIYWKRITKGTQAVWEKEEARRRQR